MNDTDILSPPDKSSHVQMEQAYIPGGLLEQLSSRRILEEEEHYNEPFGWVYADNEYPLTKMQDKYIITPEIVAVQRTKAYEGIVLASGVDPLRVQTMYNEGSCVPYDGQLIPGLCYTVRYWQSPTIGDFISGLDPNLIFVKLIYTTKDQPYYNDLAEVYAAPGLMFRVIERAVGRESYLQLLSCFLRRVLSTTMRTN